MYLEEVGHDQVYHWWDSMVWWSMQTLWPMQTVRVQFPVLTRNKMVVGIDVQISLWTKVPWTIATYEQVKDPLR